MAECLTAQPHFSRKFIKTADSDMKENYNVVTLKGTPLILLGEMVSEGKIAPDFAATDNTGKEVRLSDFKGKHIIITSFPSINTPVCATQARRFNIKASSLGDDIVVLGISRDSQEDLHKFCAAEGIKSVVTLSDRKYGDFGERYGFLVKDKDILARGTVIVDKDGEIIYAEYVPEITDEPLYEKALEALENHLLHNKFTLKPLPYAKNALAPYISAETIDFHYGKHLQTYINNLNNLLDGSPLKGKPLKEIILHSEGAMLNNAAQIFNHEFYFETLSPTPKTMPQGALMEAIEERWDNFENFKKEFSAAAISLFGSGWTWLAKDKEGVLHIIKSSNAETPLTAGYTPLMTIDVWEHAYYIDYRNRRAEYIDRIWNLLDWKTVEERYAGL